MGLAEAAAPREAAVPARRNPAGLDGLVGLADRARPVALAREQTLPVLAALVGLLPGGALQRGTTVSVGGEAATTLALSLAAGPSGAGSWVAAVGLPSLGLAAAAEVGLVLERLVLVRQPPRSSWGPVVAALVGAFDVVLLTSPHPVSASDTRRLVARSRERGSVLVVLEGAGRVGGLEADLRLRSGSVCWEGLGQGHGHLRARRVTVEASGRRSATRPRRATLWLPGPDGEIAVAEQPAVSLPRPPLPRPRPGGSIAVPVPVPVPVSVPVPVRTLVV